jgi:hypothetical protein
MASSSHIKPGEAGKITARINSKGRKGPLAKIVRVYSNDPERSVVTLSLKAVIQ